VFHSLLKIKVGNSKRVYFWKDKWLNGKTVAEIAPIVLAMVRARWRKNRTVDVVLQEKRWVLDLVGTLTAQGCIQYVSLWLQILNLDRNAEQEDEFSWFGANDGKYSAKHTYKML
jgi:hypothetical protein